MQACSDNSILTDDRCFRAKSSLSSRKDFDINRISYWFILVTRCQESHSYFLHITIDASNLIHRSMVWCLMHPI